MTWKTLTQELKELEASDPAVKKAAEKYDRMLRDVRDRKDRERIRAELAAEVRECVGGDA